LSIEEWHRLRIRAKRLRYSVDFFRSFYDRKETKRLYDGLGEIQDRLGALNDADTGRKLLAAAMAAVGAGKQTGARAHGKDDTSLARVQALVDGWYTARATLPPEGFDRLWKRLAARPPKWRRAKRARPAPDRTN
jgi:CHAD domain-containing protein